MQFIQRLAEERILAAIERGEFDDLPGEGRPLVLDDNTAVPEELRVAYRVLKNSGYMPPELELRKEIERVEVLLQHVVTSAKEKSLMRRLILLRSRLAGRGKEVDLLVEEGKYRKKLVERLGRQTTERSEP